jgi:hypothetical protein
MDFGLKSKMGFGPDRRNLNHRDNGGNGDKNTEGTENAEKINILNSYLCLLRYLCGFKTLFLKGKNGRGIQE